MTDQGLSFSDLGLLDSRHYASMVNKSVAEHLVGLVEVGACGGAERRAASAKSFEVFPNIVETKLSRSKIG